jgi:Holliday junction resolvase RusA-like endonuclease
MENIVSERKINAEKIVKKKITTIPKTFGGSTKEGEPYWKFKNAIKEGFKDSKKIDCEFEIKIQLFIEKSRVGRNKNDLDNFLKPIIDSLDEIDLIEEYKMRVIQIERIIVDKTDDQGVEISFFNA